LVQQKEACGHEQNRGCEENVSDHEKRLLKRLIFAEVSDREAQRIDWNHRVGDDVLDNEYEVRRVLLALQFRAVARVVVDALEIDRCLVSAAPAMLTSLSPVVHAHGKPRASSKTDSQVSVQTHEWRTSSRSDLLLCCRFASEVDLYS
jgi:hypothetical protein